MASKGIKIGNASDPIRIASRLARLKQSIERAKGEHKASLQAEADDLSAKLADIKAALAALEAPAETPAETPAEA